jgi:hypothetical protein
VEKNCERHSQRCFYSGYSEDPSKRGLLYAGTETGIYVSFDDGENWQSLQFNLPVTPITDLVIQKREQELVAATQGRSFWIFDDLPMLRQLMDNGGFKAASETTLFKPKDSYRMPGGGGFQLGPTATVGANPPSGLVVYYSLKTKPTNDVQLEFWIPRASRFGLRLESHVLPQVRQQRSPRRPGGGEGARGTRGGRAAPDY